MVVCYGLPEAGTPGAPREEPVSPDAGWRLGVICNPESGANRRYGLQGFRRLLEGERRIPCREARHPEQVAAALAEFTRCGINLLAVNSGDGTVQAVLTELLRSRSASELPLLVLLNGGTTNMTHRDLGLPGRPVAALRRLLAWLQRGEGKGRIVGRPVLRVEPEPAGKPYFGFFLGAAAVYRGIRFFQARIRRVGLRGNAAHLAVFLRFLGALLRRRDELRSPAAVRLAADGRDWGRRRTFLLLATTLERLILGWRPFWAAGTAPLRLTLIQAPPLWIPGAFPALLRGKSDPRLTPENGYVSLRACAVELELDGGFALDGELFPAPPGGHRVTLRPGGPVRFLRIAP
ncbi:MAG: diacylglycerol kinase family protein [Desulfobacterales bacterium]